MKSPFQNHLICLAFKCFGCQYFGKFELSPETGLSSLILGDEAGFLFSGPLYSSKGPGSVSFPGNWVELLLIEYSWRILLGGKGVVVMFRSHPSHGGHTPSNGDGQTLPTKWKKEWKLYLCSLNNTRGKNPVGQISKCFQTHGSTLVVNIAAKRL